MKHRPARNLGMSMIELIVVIAVLGVVTTLGTTAFFQMTDHWSSLQCRTQLDNRAQSVFNTMRRDFAEVLSPALSGVALRGTKGVAQHPRYKGIDLADDRVDIPIGMVGEDKISRPGRVVYSIKRAGDEGDLFRGTPDDPSKGGPPLSKGILSMCVEYAAEGNADWVEEWNRDTLPRVVRVSLTLMDPVRPWEQVSRKAVFCIPVR